MGVCLSATRKSYFILALFLINYVKSTQSSVLYLFSNNVMMGAKAKGENRHKEKPHRDKEEEIPKETGK